MISPTGCFSGSLICDRSSADESSPFLSMFHFRPKMKSERNEADREIHPAFSSMVFYDESLRELGESCAA